jgi:hypothetical protein
MKRVKNKKPINRRARAIRVPVSPLQEVFHHFLEYHPSVSRKTAFIVSLICEDLKSRKFFDGLRSIGLDNPFYQPDLSGVILASAGFAEETEDLCNFYFHLLGRHSEKMKAEIRSVEKEAFHVYEALIAEKKRRKVS